MQTRKLFSKSQKIAFLAGIMLLFLTQIAFAQTVQDIRDAILGKETATQALDVNGDGKVDVADLVRLLKNPAPTPTGERFIGTMTFDAEFALAPQLVEFIISPSGNEAQFTIDDSPFFSDTFKMSGAFSGESISFSSVGTGTFEVNDTRNPLNREIKWEFNITEVTVNEGVIEAKFTMDYTGFKPESQELKVSGTLYLNDQVPGEGLSFENADDMNLLVENYGVE